MKAIVQDRYGAPDVLALREVPDPELVDGGVLVRVRSTSVNPADWHMMRGEPRVARLQMGLRRPKDRTLGCDVAGVIEAVGPSVERFGPGDEVFGSPFEHGLGGFAELCAFDSEDLIETKPSNLSFEQTAAIPLAGMTALQALRDQGRVEAGQRVMIIGASGGVGTFAVQLAKHFGAEVTGVCSTSKVALVRSLGADEVIDRTREDFADGERSWDLIVQLGGVQAPSELRRALTREGTLVAISGDSPGRWVGPIGRAIKAKLVSPLVSQRIVVFLVEPNARDLRFLKELVEQGAVTPAIEHSYGSLNEVPEAVRHQEGGSPSGKLVVAI